MNKVKIASPSGAVKTVREDAVQAYLNSGWEQVKAQPKKRNSSAKKAQETVWSIDTAQEDPVDSTRETVDI